mgnify:CR=1 FL=1
MLIRNKRGWGIDESAATPEDIFVERRRLVKALAMGPILAPAASFLLAGCGEEDAAATGGKNGNSAAAAPADPSASLYPVMRNPRYQITRPLTDEKVVTTYNNFYEFGSHKQIHRAAQALRIRPWTVTLDGLVEKKITIGVDELMRKMPLEERLYRHRCVEAWSMTVPWSGFALKALVDFAKPLGSAKYVRMETFSDAEMAPGQKQFWYPWPYVEGLTIAEAVNELAFIATGLYGKPMPKQNGSPLRLVVPWKYGFKSIKSIVRISFVEEMPMTSWWQQNPGWYGFYSNVNPNVSRQRWSQKRERRIGDFFKRETLMFNGYGDEVASLYTGMDLAKYF